VARDDDQSTFPEQQPAGVLNDPYTRRRFLRAAVVGTAGVAGAAGVAGVALASGHGPKLLSGPLPVAVLSTGCIEIVEGSKGGDPNTNHFLEIDPADQPKIPDGSCIVLTASSGNAPPFKTTVTLHEQKKNSTHTLLCICPSIPDIPGMDEYPAMSTICLSTDCPTPTNCDSCVQ
jgi:hypothetical protein